MKKLFFYWPLLLATISASIGIIYFDKLKVVVIQLIISDYFYHSTLVLPIVVVLTRFLLKSIYLNERIDPKKDLNFRYAQVFNDLFSGSTLFGSFILLRGFLLKICDSDQSIMYNFRTLESVTIGLLSIHYIYAEIIFLRKDVSSYLSKVKEPLLEPLIDPKEFTNPPVVDESRVV